ncbi:MAG: ankyrin repeat domain-containing protein [Sedimenticola sp.]
MATNTEESEDDINIKLLAAIRANNGRKVKQLLREGADPNSRTANDVDGSAGPLHSAVRLKHTDIVRILFEHEADANIEDEDGDTPLFSAVYTEIPSDIRNLLIKYGADKNHKNKCGVTALTKMLEDYMHWGFMFDKEMLLDILISCNDLNQRTTNGMYLIHLLSGVHSSEINQVAPPDHVCLVYLNLLIKKGIPVDTLDPLGRTAIHYAASACCYASIKLLIEEGVNANVKDMKGQTPIHQLGRYTSEQDFSKTLDILIQHGCDINERDSFGRTVVHYLANSDSTTKHSLVILYDRGAILTVKDNANMTAIHVTVLPTMQVSYKEPEDDYPSKPGAVGVIKFLVEQGVAINETDSSGLTPLHLAVRERSTEVIQALLQLGADVNKPTKTGESALHRATIDTQTFDCLMNACRNVEIDINMQDNFGSTAVHWAAWYFEKSVIKLLRMAGADFNTKDMNGNTAADLAFKHKRTNVYEDLDIIYDREYYPLIQQKSDEILDGLLDIVNALKESKNNIVAVNEDDIVDDTHDDSADENNDDDAIREDNYDGYSGKKYKQYKNDSESDNDTLANPHIEHDPKDLIPHLADANTAQIDQCPDLSNTEDDALDTSEAAYSEAWESIEEDECSGRNYLYPECPLLMTIHNQEDFVNLMPWKMHLQDHKAALQKFVKMLLNITPQSMALFQETPENQDVATAVHALFLDISKTINTEFPLFKNTISLAGSWNEGTKTTCPSEFDYNWRLCNFSTPFKIEESTTVAGGFVRFRLKEGMETSEFAKYVNGEGYLDGRKVIRDFYQIINDVLLRGDIKCHNSIYIRRYLHIDKGSIGKLVLRWVGPLYKDILVEADIVPSILVEEFTPSYIKLDRKLISSLPDAVELDVVLKTPNERFVSGWNTYFRISVARLEAGVIKSLPASVRKGYSLVKALRDTLYMPQVHNDREDYLMENMLTTYKLKTCFLHVLEAAANNYDATLSLPKTDTSKAVTIDLANRIMAFLFQATENAILPCFFVSDVNLLVHESTSVCNDLYICESECFCLRELVRVGTED